MKNLKNLGQALTKAEQKVINGGRRPWMCAPFPNQVACPTKHQCQQDSNGNWYCA